MPTNTQPAPKAMLVKLNIRIFPNSRNDKEITEEVRRQKKIKAGAGRWIKVFFPPATLKPIREVASQARNYHYDTTMPWEDGCRIIPAKSVESYMAQIMALQIKFQEAVDNFPYKAALAEAKEMHGPMFDAKLFPSQRDFPAYFAMTREFMAVPKAEHFARMGIAEQAIEEMKEENERAITERMHTAVKDTMIRVMEPVRHIADKLSSPDAIFRDALIENVREVLQLVPVLNITGDAKLSELAQEIETKFASLDPQALRDNVTARRAAANNARELVKRFGKLGERKFMD